MSISMGAIIILAAVSSFDQTQPTPRPVAARPRVSAVADSLIERDRLREAAALLDSAIALHERGGGVGCDELADLLVLRARILNDTGKHNEALPLFERSLAIKIKRWGPDHPEAARPALGIASVYNKRGDFADAGRISRQWFAVLEDARGPAHRTTAEAAVVLSECLVNLGDYAGAEEVLRRCFDATVAARGERNAQAGMLMLRLADVLGTRGKHVESTRLFRRAAAIIEETCGPDHALTAEALSGLAHTLRRVGKRAAAKALYERSIRIIERNHGCPHPNTIHYRCRLGLCFDAEYLVDEGLPSIERGIAEAVEIYGEDSYQVAIEERHLGIVQRALNSVEDGYAIFKKALATLERYFGPRHLYLSKCLKGLSSMGARLGFFEEAYACINRAISIQEYMSSEDRLELAVLLRSKTSLEWRMRRWDDAIATSVRSTEASLAVTEEHYQVYSTAEAVMLAYSPRASVETLVSAMASHPGVADSTRERIFSYLIKAHGMILDRLAERRRVLAEVEDPARVERMWRDYEEATQRVADLVVNEHMRNGMSYRDELATAYRRLEEAERALAALVEQARNLSRTSAVREISVEDLADALERSMTLVHFVRFRLCRFNESTDRVEYYRRYGAFRLRSAQGDSRDLEFVDLGSRASIDSLIFSYRRVIDGMEPGRRPSAREEAEYRAVARGLYDRIWAPILPHGEQTLHREASPDSVGLVFIIPAGWMNLLDFNTLLAPSGELVIERHRLHLLSSATDLLRSSRRGSYGWGLLAAGNPALDPGAGVEETPPGGTGAPMPCADVFRVPEPLPGAEKETVNVSRLFSSSTGEPITVLTGRDATEENIKKLIPGKRIVHLATHGFFCEEDKRSDYPSEDRMINPLLMSGLVTASSEEDDGFLTAQELVCTDLQSLDWVVLSACGTALGRLVWGEGLFGLRRAFEIAGARTVVTALWRIDDTATRELVERIYQYRLAGSSTVDAVRRAQLERLREQRRHLNRIHPALWGGIIAEGDWR